MTCDVIAVSDTGMVGPGMPTYSYGLRGIACCEVTLRGPATDLPSGIFGGAVANPATGKRTLDLETGKYWLDILGMVRDKTNGNLHPQESRLLEGSLGDLRMQYVSMIRATEDKLKAEAAQKFSGADILGKK